MIKSSNESKTLFIDIENTPLVSYTWGRYEQNVVDVQQESYILSFAYKWLGVKKTKIIALNDFKEFKKDKTDDKKLLEEIHKVLSQADILVGHNIDAFDVKKINARFIYHGLTPIGVSTVDTVKIARKYFKFSSNKLDDLGKYLKVGRKESTGGFNLWLECMSGDKSAWKKMKKYNIQDVDLLEKIYFKLRSWCTNHPTTLYVPDVTDGGTCPTCSGKLHRNGIKRGVSYSYVRYVCQGCGRWLRGEKVGEKDGNTDFRRKR